jgi:hypothetical protein
VYDQHTTNLTLYVDLDVSSIDDDPQAISTAADMGTGSPNGTSIGTISPDNNNEAWNGYIDNVFFFNGAVDAATIRAIRDAGAQGILEFKPDPVLAVLTPDPLFGTLPDGTPKTVQILLTNSGTTKTLTFEAVRIAGIDAAAYSVGPLPAPIPPGGTALISVTFNPAIRSGPFSATLDFISNDSVDRHTLLNLNAFVPYTAPLLGFYTFDDPAHPLKEARGMGPDLIPVADSLPTYRSAGGAEGGAYEYFGAQRLIAPFNISADNFPQLTMGAWVRATDISSGLRKVMGQDDGGWDRAIGLDNREGDFRYTSFIGNGPPVVGLPGATSTEQWSFFAATYDQAAGQVTVYLDPDTSTTDDPLLVATSSGSFGAGWTTVAIGGIRPDQNSEGWVGLIDNVFFYQTALTVDELTALRDSGSGGIVTPAPKITSVVKAGGLTLTWTSVANKTYAIQYVDTLGSAWTQIATQPSGGTTTSYQDTDATRMGRAKGFYRVVMQP